MIILTMPDEVFARVRDHLLKDTVEQVAFLFAEDRREDANTILDVTSWHAVPPEGFAAQSEFYVELSDEEKARVIKMAWDRRAALVEIHSHPRALQAEFSWSDRNGLEEFVPHVRWRLKGKPYLALIVGARDMDALAWVGEDATVRPVDEIRTGSEIIKPSGKTYQMTLLQGDQDG